MAESEMFIEPGEHGDPPTTASIDDEIDPDDLYTAVAFDPGETTGWAVFGVHRPAIEDPEYRIIDNIAFWSAGQFIGSERAHALQMYNTVTAWPSARIVVEDFVLRKFSSARELLAPVRVTARFDERLAAGGDARRIILQQGSLAMSTITDERLKRMGLYQPLIGKEHARDAVRHNLTWLKRAKKISEKNMLVNALRPSDDD